MVTPAKWRLWVVPSKGPALLHRGLESWRVCLLEVALRGSLPRQGGREYSHLHASSGRFPSSPKLATGLPASSSILMNRFAIGSLLC